MSNYIHARVYRGKDDDLINWLDSLPEGKRSEVVRETLRAGLGLLPPSSSEELDIAAIVRQAVHEALADLKIVAAQQGGAVDANDVEKAFGQQLDQLLSRF